MGQASLVSPKVILDALYFIVNAELRLGKVEKGGGEYGDKRPSKDATTRQKTETQ